MVKWGTAVLCAYEVAAITTGRVPTLTALSRGRPWLGVCLVGGLSVHLYRARGPS